MPWLQFAQKPRLIVRLLQVKHVSLFIFPWLNNTKTIKCDKVGEGMAGAAPRVSNVGRRAKDPQLPASPGGETADGTGCPTGHRAAR